MRKVGLWLNVWPYSQRQCVTHSAVDGAQRHEALHVVGDRAAVSVPVRVLSSLQDELLALEVVVLETDPAAKRTLSLYFLVLNSLLQSLLNQSPTYAPLSTLMERMLSSPQSWMLVHSEVNSKHLPWKCSCSNTVT